MDPGFTLRPYQLSAVDAASSRNLLVVLPTNSGKTVIAAECVLRTLQQEATKKVVFLAPRKALALQQARLLLHHIGLLRTNVDGTSRNDGDLNARFRLGVSAGLGEDNG